MTTISSRHVTSANNFHQPHLYTTSVPVSVSVPEIPFVRARFDFTATDPSALSFKVGDVIEVITRLESGWWDGVLGGTRGWFPSNFVVEVDVDVQLDEGFEDDGWELAEGERGGCDGVGEKVRMREGEFGLEELAREMMKRTGDKDGVEGGGGGNGRLDGVGNGMNGLNGNGNGESGEQQGRRREGTDETVLGLQPSAMPRPVGNGIIRGEERKVEEGELEDAWVPSLTPDGRVSEFIHFF